MRRQSKKLVVVLLLWTSACCGAILLNYLWLFRVDNIHESQGAHESESQLSSQKQPWKDDVHLSSNHRHHGTTDLYMKPLDDYIKYMELSSMEDEEEEECTRNSSLITNTSLAYLLDLDTPCSLGKQHCVVSFALWCPGVVKHGLAAASHRVPNPQCHRYVSHLSNLYGWTSIFRGWEVRLYTDGSVPNAVLEPYEDIVNIILVNESLRGGGTWGTMWRLLPLWDASVDRFVTRDIDSVPLVRDWATTYEWIRLGIPSYRWGDHVQHYSHPILAGALGVWIDRAFTDHQRTVLRQKLFGSQQRTTTNTTTGRTTSILPRLRYMDRYGDQEWYERELYPLLRKNNKMLSYDVYHCGEYPNWHPFPVPHSQCDWIMGGPDHLFGKQSVVSTECRHPNHTSWKWG